MQSRNSFAKMAGTQVENEIILGDAYQKVVRMKAEGAETSNRIGIGAGSRAHQIFYFGRERK